MYEYVYEALVQAASRDFLENGYHSKLWSLIKKPNLKGEKKASQARF